jgi:hypothetical protein
MHRSKLPADAIATRPTARKRIGRPTPALFISVISLFVGLGGVGYATATIDPDSTAAPDSPGAAERSLVAASIPSGTTVTGAWGGRYIAPQLPFNNSYLISSSFPTRAPTGLSDAQVNAAPNAAAGDPDTTCTGSPNNPTAPRGKVCVYISRANNASVTGFRLTNPGVPGTSFGDAHGFIVRILDAGTVGNTATTNAEGTWAYTAP